MRIGAFLTLLGVYLLMWVDMRLVFWNQNDLFLWNFRFARGFLISPGQPGQWLGRLLLQSCCYGWLGSLVVVTVVWVLLISARGFFSRIEPSARRYDTSVVPAVFLVVLHSQYTFSLSDTAGLALALAASNVYARIACRGAWARLGVFIAVSMVLYYVAGEAYYTFTGCCLVYELLTARRRGLGLLLLLAAAAVKFGIDAALLHANSAYLHFDVPEDSYLIPRRSMEQWILAALHAYFPACALFISIKPATSWLLKRPWQRVGRVGIWRWVVIPILLVVVAGTGVKLSRTSSKKKILAIDYYSSHRMWAKVLQEAGSVPPRVHPDYVGQDVYRALYHTGRLPYDMFSYPPSRLIVAHGYGNRGRLISRKAFDLYLELGRVNEAETIVHNALEQHVSAELLMRIAVVKMVKGQMGAARLYLNVLSDDLLYGRRAKGYLERLQQDPDLAGDPEILKVRSLMIRRDDAYFVYGKTSDRSIPVSAERQLLSLLEENPRNKMAFEYLMAFQLLKTDVEALVAQLPRVREFFYPRMPPLYEEAAMLCAIDYANDLVPTGTGVTACGWPISEETLRRCGRLQEISGMYRGLENPTARDAAARRLGNTFLFHYFYGPNQSR